MGHLYCPLSVAFRQAEETLRLPREWSSGIAGKHRRVGKGHRRRGEFPEFLLNRAPKCRFLILVLVSDFEDF